MVANGIAARLRMLFRLWWLYTRMDLLWITRVPKLFLSYYFSDAILNIAAITAMVLLAERFDGIGVWTSRSSSSCWGTRP
jgi:ABC-2 type transport system permease protein